MTYPFLFKFSVNTFYHGNIIFNILISCFPNDVHAIHTFTSGHYNCMLHKRNETITQSHGYYSVILAVLLYQLLAFVHVKLHKQSKQTKICLFIIFIEKRKRHTKHVIVIEMNVKSAILSMASDEKTALFLFTAHQEINAMQTKATAIAIHGSLQK